VIACPAIGAYVPRFSPVVLILFSAISFFIGKRIVTTSVPSVAAICSPRWPGFLLT
jgi:hypothetical protein